MRSNDDIFEYRWIALELLMLAVCVSCCLFDISLYKLEIYICLPRYEDLGLQETALKDYFQVAAVDIPKRLLSYSCSTALKSYFRVAFGSS